MSLAELAGQLSSLSIAILQLCFQKSSSGADEELQKEPDDDLDKIFWRRKKNWEDLCYSKI